MGRDAEPGADVAAQPVERGVVVGGVEPVAHHEPRVEQELEPDVRAGGGGVGQREGHADVDTERPPGQPDEVAPRHRTARAQRELEAVAGEEEGMDGDAAHLQEADARGVGLPIEVGAVAPLYTGRHRGAQAMDPARAEREAAEGRAGGAVEVEGPEGPQLEAVGAEGLVGRGLCALRDDVRLRLLLAELLIALARHGVDVLRQTESERVARAALGGLLDLRLSEAGDRLLRPSGEGAESVRDSDDARVGLGRAAAGGAVTIARHDPLHGQRGGQDRRRRVHHHPVARLEVDIVVLPTVVATPAGAVVAAPRVAGAVVRLALQRRRAAREVPLVRDVGRVAGRQGRPEARGPAREVGRLAEASRLGVAVVRGLAARLRVGGADEEEGGERKRGGDLLHGVCSPLGQRGVRPVVWWSLVASVSVCCPGPSLSACDSRYESELLRFLHDSVSGIATA